MIKPCSCMFHARCTALTAAAPMKYCPCCNSSCNGMYLMPMSFGEMDQAKKAAAEAAVSGKRERKRKSATIARLHPEAGSSTSLTEMDSGEIGESRTGRWTPEEIAYCDLLVASFGNGELPVNNGTRLNDFLAIMLKSKQSRLTKKMKNAKFSTQSFQRTVGYISKPLEARQFSEAEESFINSISCSMERAEIRFHVQKEWRELFSGVCVSLGQALNADDWLVTVEEVDRRLSASKDLARMQRRKKMMGYALSEDSKNQDEGVFIDRMSDVSDQEGSVNGSVSCIVAKPLVAKKTPVRIQPPPFLGRVISYMERHMVPFEHIDAWVPSFVNNQRDQKCRLCYAGAATSDMQVGLNSRGSMPISMEDKVDLYAFGDYSKKFSFDVGCGLPGRVYQSGVPSWEQNVQSAPLSHFERGGGASQWGIKTVLGVPIPSPNVGRIVVLMYSRYDRTRDQEMVVKLVNEMTNLLPSPKWKLVVDVAPNSESQVKNKGIHGEIMNPADIKNESMKDDEMSALIQEYMPLDSTSPYLPGFTSLLLLLRKRTSHTPREAENLKTLTNQFVTYMSQNKSRHDVAILLARDFMAITQQQQLNIQAQPQQPLEQQQTQPLSFVSHPHPLQGIQGSVSNHQLLQLTPAQLSLVSGGGLTPVLLSHPSHQQDLLHHARVHLDPLSQLQPQQQMQQALAQGAFPARTKPAEVVGQHNPHHYSQQSQQGSSSNNF